MNERAQRGEDSDWSDRAACIGEDPELFFYKGSEDRGEAAITIPEAKAICRRCEVRDKCLEWSLASDQEFGVWGGLDQAERRAMKARMTRSLGQIATNY